MRENEYMDFTPPIPVTEGWSRMQMLLDEQMPVAPKKKPLMYYWFAAALLCLLLAGLPLKEPVVNNGGRYKMVEENTSNTTFTQSDTDINPAAAFAYHKTVQPGIVNAPLIFVHTQQNELNNQSSGHNTTLPAPDITSDTIITTIATEEIAMEKVTAIDSANIAKKKTVVKKSKWQLFAGVSANVVTSEKSKNFQPYPSAELRFAPDKHFFIATGLSVLSPVTTSTSALEKSYLLNDTLNNVKLYNENIVYTRLHYIDVPLTAGIHLTKHLSVSAGIQASLLLYSASYHNAESYDFQMNRLEMQTTGLMPSPYMDKPDQSFRVEPKKVELRYVAGADYRLNRFLLGIRYQHATASAIKGEVTSGKKNNLFSVGLKYQIR